MSTRSPFEAIADPTRRHIIELLHAEGPLRAGEIAAHFTTLSRPAVSKHLRVLHEAKLVTQQHAGRERWYVLAPEPLREVNEWLERFAAVWSDRLHTLKHLIEDDSPTEDTDHE